MYQINFNSSSLIFLCLFSPGIWFWKLYSIPKWSGLSFEKRLESLSASDYVKRHRVCLNFETQLKYLEWADGHSNKASWIAAYRRSWCTIAYFRCKILVWELVTPAGLAEAVVGWTVVWYCCRTHPVGVALLAEMITVTNVASKLSDVLPTRFKKAIFHEKTMSVMFLAL